MDEDEEYEEGEVVTTSVVYAPNRWDLVYNAVATLGGLFHQVGMFFQACSVDAQAKAQWVRFTDAREEARTEAMRDMGLIEDRKHFG